MTDRRRPAHTRGEHLLQIAEAKNSGEQMSALSSHNSHGPGGSSAKFASTGRPRLRKVLEPLADFPSSVPW